MSDDHYLFEVICSSDTILSPDFQIDEFLTVELLMKVLNYVALGQSEMFRFVGRYQFQGILISLVIYFGTQHDCWEFFANQKIS